jgi:hypothetical protein
MEFRMRIVYHGPAAFDLGIYCLLALFLFLSGRTMLPKQQPPSEMALTRRQPPPRVLPAGRRSSPAVTASWSTASSRSSPAPPAAVRDTLRAKDGNLGNWARRCVWGSPKVSPSSGKIRFVCAYKPCVCNVRRPQSLRLILYQTTREFLIQFGLKDLSELPSLKEFEEIRRMAFADTEQPGLPGMEEEEAVQAPNLPDAAPPAPDPDLPIQEN